MKLMTTVEVIAYLSISRTQLWRLVKAGAITPVYVNGDESKHPRFREADVQALCKPAVKP